MTFQQIRAEVEARGYQYIPQERLDGWIRQAYEWVCAQEPWPFLETETTGAAPLTISNLSQVLWIGYDDVVLRGTDLRDIRDRDPDLDDTGDPTHWYLDGNTIKTWPTSDKTLYVRFIQKPPTFTDVDEPLIPSAYQEVIIDGAVMRGLKDNDEYDTAQALQAGIDRDVQAMRDALMVRNYQNPQTLVQSGIFEDYIA
jgi:hypothetical protein